MENNELDIDLEELKRRNANPTGAKYIPVHCPRCKSRNTKFLPEYRKCIGLRFFTSLFLVLAVVLCFFGLDASMSVNTKDDDSATAFFIFGAICAIIALVFYTVRLYRESKTHVQCVCPDCGKVWIHKW